MVDEYMKNKIEEKPSAFGYVAKLGELQKEIKGYETVYKRALLKNEESKKLDRWYADLCFREKLIILNKYKVDDWFELTLKEKQSVYEGEHEEEEEPTEKEKMLMYADSLYQRLKEDDL
jgi:hypothetical protein